MTSENKLSGYRFGFFGASSESVLFSTQIEGWAEVIQSVHRAVPTRVPNVQELEAWTVLSSLELPDDAAALTAPPFGSPERQVFQVARWYDFWLAYAFGLLILLLPAHVFNAWLIAEGVGDKFRIVLIVPIVLFSCELLRPFITSTLKRLRQQQLTR